MRNILVAGPFTKESLSRLSGEADLHWLNDLGREELDALLPSIECVFVHFWPKELDSNSLRKMTQLSFVQSALAGVNHIPFGDLPAGVTVSSNAGGYSGEVAEFAWGLVLSAAKRIVRLHRTVEENRTKSSLELGRDVIVLNGRTLGVLGYGGIGGSVARIGEAFGMKIMVLSRKTISAPGINFLSGENGFQAILTDSDVVVVALPLTNSTRNILGGKELAMMKKNAVLVNVARGEIVDQQAVYGHLMQNKDFVYATDVWWMKDGREAYPPELPFFALDNFIGTPHVAGPSAVARGTPLSNAIDNLSRFARGEVVKNMVDRADYL